MTLIDLLTLVACVIAGVFVVRFGNRALREQRAERYHRRPEGLDSGRERGDSNDRRTEALVRLNEWRRAGVLVISDEDYELAVEFGRYNPGQLEHLIKATQQIIGRGELKPGDAIHLTVRVEYENVPENAASTEASVPSARASRGHLELIAAFG